MGNKVKEMREAAGLSISMLSHKTLLADTTIKSIERGNANPTIGTLQKIADCFGCRVIDLIDADGK